jgi:murein DD-endopeptidase MepM/ murein hydrolase activator NlpD
VDKLTRPFSDPYVVLAGCAVGVALAVAVLLAASPAFAGDGGGLSPDDATQTKKTPTSTTPSAQSPSAFPAGFGRRTLRRGARGGDVRYLQSLLGRLGFRTGVDGMFGSGTQTKVRAWERSVRGLVDGRVPPGQAREMLRRAGTAQQSQPAQPQPTQTAPAGQYAFPVAGPHNYGTSINRYGAARSGHTHSGQDVMANCGIRLVAAHAGKVSTVDSGGGGGNYLVIQSTDQTDMVYMHLRSMALVREGQTVTAGQLVGYVGQTGDASACHLHFELWTAHWFDGGHSFDPLPRLKQWDAAS